MWEYPVYLINLFVCFLFFCQEIAENHIFYVILKVAFEIFHTKQELVLYKPQINHNICKS